MSNRSDNFDRANSSSGLGTPSDGGSAWVDSATVCGISSNQAYLPSGSYGQGVLETSSSGTPDDTQVTVAVAPSSIESYLLTRYIDDNNFWMVIILAGSGLRLYKKVAGSNSQQDTYGTAISNGDVIKVNWTGDTCTVYRNGSQVMQAGDASNNTGTKVGLIIGDTTTRFDDFSYGTGGGSAPTLSSPTVPTGGTTLTATLDQSGCIPTSGTGGFTLGGTSATVSSWAISGTTLTLTLSGTVYSGETVTYSYDRATTTDDISDSGGSNFLANFSGTSVTNDSTQTQPLTAGTASLSSSGPTTIVVTATDATGGTPSYTYQWQRNTNGGSYSNISNGGGVSGATTLTITDGSGSAGNLYGYQLVYTDSAGSPATDTSNAITAQLYSGGALGGGAAVFGSGVFV